MCTLEIPQKLLAVQVLALNFLLSLLLSLFLKLSFSQTMSFSCIFVIASFFHSYGSFNCANSTSLSFSEFPELFLSILLLSQLIESHLHLHLPGVTSDIIMSILHESSMFFTSLYILDVLLVSFHHASSWFLRVPVCSSLGLLLIGPEASHHATIKRWGNT